MHPHPRDTAIFGESRRTDKGVHNPYLRGRHILQTMSVLVVWRMRARPLIGHDDARLLGKAQKRGYQRRSGRQLKPPGRSEKVSKGGWIPGETELPVSRTRFWSEKVCFEKKRGGGFQTGSKTKAKRDVRRKGKKKKEETTK